MKNKLIDMTKQQVTENDKNTLKSVRRLFETLKYVPINKTVLIYRIKPASKRMKWVVLRVHIQYRQVRRKEGLERMGCDSYNMRNLCFCIFFTLFLRLGFRISKNNFFFFFYICDLFVVTNAIISWSSSRAFSYVTHHIHSLS